MKRVDAEGNVLTPAKPEQPKIFTTDRFLPATDRLLLRRLPPPPEGTIVKPQIAVEQSEYGFVIATGADVNVPCGVVAKFSRFSAEEIHFDDQEDGEEFVVAYKHDIRGWFAGGCLEEPRGNDAVN